MLRRRNVIRADHQCQAMRFVDFWNTVTGEEPQWLYLDSKVADYPNCRG